MSIAPTKSAVASFRFLTRLLFLAILLAPSTSQPALAEEPGEPQTTSEIQLVSNGRVSYNNYCRSCHGATAKGDGSVAAVLTIPPSDLTQISATNGGEFPFDAVYKTIDGREVKGHGSRDMPIWGNAFKDTEETTDELVVKEKIVELVYFLKSIQEAAD